MHKKIENLWLNMDDPTRALELSAVRIDQEILIRPVLRQISSKSPLKGKFILQSFSGKP
jgi:hypothetical protein